jgi:MFS family permease
MYLLFTTFPATFSGQYNFNPGESGLAFIGFGLGCIVGLFSILAFSDKVTVAQAEKSQNKEARPESRLILMLYGVLALPIGLFWYGWSAEAKTHWIVPILGTFVLALGIMAASVSLT